jgi:hypothetical protein
MSWSISVFGTVAGVKAALATECARYSGQSRKEFDDARPHLEGLLDQIVIPKGQLVRLVANGHATFNHVDGQDVKTFGHVSVTLEPSSVQLALDPPAAGGGA